MFQKNNHYSAAMAVDGDMETRWATDSGISSAWLQIDLGSLQTFSKIAIHEWNGGPGRVRKFTVDCKESKDAPDWKTLFEGTTIGPEFTKSFPPATARIVALTITEATDGPTIDEIEIQK